MTRATRILALNAGSSSLKFLLTDTGEVDADVCRGAVTDIGTDAHLVIRDPRGEIIRRRVPAQDHAQALAAIVEALQAKDPSAMTPVAAIGHRLVHGGPAFKTPTVLDAAALMRLRELSHLAPLHLPPALQVIESCAQRHPVALPVGVFDTTFFHALPETARDYAIPAEWSAELGLHRYGFHGIAHRDMRDHAIRTLGTAQARRLISFQLGNGCSAAAILDGLPRDTSMGFTPLEGLVMGTRSGDLDPGILLDLLDRGWTRERLHDALHHRSGLLGVSGLSADMAALLQAEHAGHAGARRAVELFVHRARKYLGAYLAVLGGADAIVFGGGIGEHAPDVRRRICSGLDWCGLRIDEHANAACTGGSAVIGHPQSKIAVLVCAVDEERHVAREALRLLGPHGPRA